MQPVGVMKKAKIEIKKKEKRPKDMSNCLFTQTTHIELLPPKLSCGVGSWTSSYISSFIEISSVVSALQDVKTSRSPILSTMAYVTG